MQQMKIVLLGYSRRQVKHTLQLQQYRHDQALQEAQERIQQLKGENQQLRARLEGYEQREAGISGAMIAAATRADELLQEGRVKLQQEQAMQEQRLQAMQAKRLRAGKQLQTLLEQVCQCERFFTDELRTLLQDLQS